VIYSIDVRIEAPVRDTEVTDRVADAIRNVFPDAEPIHEDGRLVAEGHTLDAFSDVLHEQEILDTARRVFLQNSTDGVRLLAEKAGGVRGRRQLRGR